MEVCGRSSGLDVPTGNGCHLGVTGQSGSSDKLGVPFRESIYKTACISKINLILLLFYIYAHIFGNLQKTVPRQSIIVTLEYMPSKCVKLLYCLSDPQEPHINWISSEISSGTLSGPLNSCFICIHMHEFLVCIPSFCKKGKPLKPKHQLLR